MWTFLLSLDIFEYWRRAAPLSRTAHAYLQVTSFISAGLAAEASKVKETSCEVGHNAGPNRE
jgi:hypothetical protein